MGERLTAEREAFVRACVSEIARPDFDAADHIILELLAELDALRAERDEARKAYAEREGDMHTRIRAGYDRTIADAWRAEVAKVTARAERAEAGLAALRDADIEYDAAYYAFNSTHQVGSPEEARVVPRMVAAAERRKTALADTAAAAEAHTRSVADAAIASLLVMPPHEPGPSVPPPWDTERERLTICRRCGDTVTPGTMNARGVLHAAEGVECGTCVDDGGYERRVRAEALEAASLALANRAGDLVVCNWLRARAAEIRGGR